MLVESLVKETVELQGFSVLTVRNHFLYRADSLSMPSLRMR